MTTALAEMTALGRSQARRTLVAGPTALSTLLGSADAPVNLLNAAYVVPVMAVTACST